MVTHINSKTMWDFFNPYQLFIRGYKIQYYVDGFKYNTLDKRCKLCRKWRKNFNLNNKKYTKIFSIKNNLNLKYHA